MKDKPAKAFSMQDQLMKYQTEEPTVLQEQETLADDNIQEETGNMEQELAAIKLYNENVTTLDPLYAGVVPVTKVLLRVFLHEPNISPNGIITPHKQIVAVPTQNGMATLREVESPYPYSNKAVIVATPQITSFQPGQIVQLGVMQVRAQISGQGKNAQVGIPNAYLHPNANTYNSPTKVDDQHYGYLLIPAHEIDAIL